MSNHHRRCSSMSSGPNFQSALMTRPPSPPRRSISTSARFDTQSANKIGGNGRFVWVIKRLKSPPRNFPLEHSSLKLTGIAPEIISARISNFMHRNSISCRWHSSRVDCRTINMLMFVVQLWQIPSSPDAILVEVQRRQGCAVEMRDIRFGLFDALRGDVSTIRTIGHDSIRFCDVPPSLSLPADELQENCLLLSLSLLESSYVDRNQLGLESLISLTNNSSFHHTRQMVSRAIVFGEGPHAHRLRNCLAGFLVNTCKNNCKAGDFGKTSCFDDSDDEDDEDSVMLYSGGYFDSMVLRILANALEFVAQADSKKSISNTELDTFFWRKSVEDMVYNIEVSKERPMEAASSAKCLYLLLGLAPQLLAHFRNIEVRLLPVLMDAQEFGRCHLASLERESRNLMGRLAETH